MRHQNSGDRDSVPGARRRGEFPAGWGARNQAGYVPLVRTGGPGGLLHVAQLLAADWAGAVSGNGCRFLRPTPRLCHTPPECRNFRAGAAVRALFISGAFFPRLGKRGGYSANLTGWPVRPIVWPLQRNWSPRRRWRPASPVGLRRLRCAGGSWFSAGAEIFVTYWILNCIYWSQLATRRLAAARRLPNSLALRFRW